MEEVAEPKKISQGFECEEDDRNWFSCRVEGTDLIVRMYSDNDTMALGDPTPCRLGSWQVKNLIQFLQDKALPAMLTAP
jgi:hypothetical protein